MTTISDPIVYMNLTTKNLSDKVLRGEERIIRRLDQYTEITLQDLWDEYVEIAKYINETGKIYNKDETSETGY